MNNDMNSSIKILSEHATTLRKDVLKMIYEAGDGHPGPSLSIADIISVLYFKILNIDPQNPHWEDRDRFILSKGHACPVLYAALARRGYFSIDHLKTLRSFNSILQGHPDMLKTPGVDFSSGSLGHGISLGLGIAMAGRIRRSDYYTYVITGDGELQEGIIWEAAMAAVKFRANRLIVFVDNNGFQSGGEIKVISSLEPILSKWEAFGWYCQEIDGHDYLQILKAIDNSKNELDRPSLILAHTIKGKGVSFMENNNVWHKAVPSKKQLEIALEELGGEMN